MSAKQSEITGHLTAAVDNIVAGASYQHVDPQVRDEEQDDEDEADAAVSGTSQHKDLNQGGRGVPCPILHLS